MDIVKLAGGGITRRFAPRPSGRRVRGVQFGRTAELVLGAARLALRVAGAKPPALNLAFGQVVEPGLFYVAGSTRMAYLCRIAMQTFS